MPDVTKNQAIIAALKSAGYQQVTLRVVPKLSQFNDGPRLSELEFSRNYFEEATLATLQALMREKAFRPSSNISEGRSMCTPMGSASSPKRMNRKGNC